MRLRSPVNAEAFFVGDGLYGRARAAVVNLVTTCVVRSPPLTRTVHDRQRHGKSITQTRSDLVAALRSRLPGAQHRARGRT